MPISVIAFSMGTIKTVGGWLSAEGMCPSNYNVSLIHRNPKGNLGKDGRVDVDN